MGFQLLSTLAFSEDAVKDTPIILPLARFASYAVVKLRSRISSKFFLDLCLLPKVTLFLVKKSDSFCKKRYPLRKQDKAVQRTMSMLHSVKSGLI